ncbi:NADPH-dependent FMN reductase [Halococcus saccharolyticus]|uniref:NADPH-dependent FMN reductase n=1 Tax=Halococcus saccharolyticus DSM 5350 TaxID=1227455 RepID=M0MRA5_9EURY|nr:NADPH-dependent FMN reductase [Halococcus saccharolyticus]EMA47274.1 NADPH-dependent FMN reductase [Halococcus saccharolyticus DSM 5350]
MPDRPHVVALVGSLRDGSYTRIALQHALDEAEERGASTDLIDLRHLDLAVFDADAREVGDALALKRRIRRADSVLLGTPSYHGSYSSILKTALDYCGFDEFENTTVGLLSVSGGAFPITPLDHLRSVARALNAWVIPHQAAIPKASGKFADGELTDESSRERVATLGQRAVEYATIEPDPPCLESTENVGADD